MNITKSEKKIIDAYLLVAETSPSRKDITIKKIANKAGISTQAIYKSHFKGVEGIVQTLHLIISSETNKKLQEFNPKKMYFIPFIAQELLPILYSHRRELKILYNINLDPTYQDFLEQKYKTWAKPYISDMPSYQADYYLELVLKQIIAIIIHWLNSEIPEPPSLFQEKFIALLSTPTADMVKK